MSCRSSSLSITSVVVISPRSFNQLNYLFGASVSWTNDDRIPYSVTAIEGEFDSDEVFEYTFDKAGSFEYYCILHPSMIGRVGGSLNS